MDATSNKSSDQTVPVPAGKSSQPMAPKSQERTENPNTSAPVKEHKTKWTVESFKEYRQPQRSKQPKPEESISFNGEGPYCADCLGSGFQLIKERKICLSCEGTGKPRHRDSPSKLGRLSLVPEAGRLSIVHPAGALSLEKSEPATELSELEQQQRYLESHHIELDHQHHQERRRLRIVTYVINAFVSTTAVFAMLFFHNCS